MNHWAESNRTRVIHAFQPILVTLSTVYENNRVAKLLVLKTSINLCATEPMETTIVKISPLKTVTVQST